MSKKVDKKEIIEQIAQMIESDPGATPLSLDILEFMSQEELLSVLNNLYKAKENRSYDNEAWFDSLCKKD